jgi:hypothetical protein
MLQLSKEEPVPLKPFSPFVDHSDSARATGLIDIEGIKLHITRTKMQISSFIREYEI